MKILSGCPGSIGLRGAPNLKIKICPECGSEIELFSNEVSSNCEKCNFTAWNNIQSCIAWCEKAKECVGEEMYNRMMSVPKEAEGA